MLKILNLKLVIFTEKSICPEKRRGIIYIYISKFTLIEILLNSVTTNGRYLHSPHESSKTVFYVFFNQIYFIDCKE